MYLVSLDYLKIGASRLFEVDTEVLLFPKTLPLPRFEAEFVESVLDRE